MAVAVPQAAVSAQTPGSADQAQREHSTQPEQRKHEVLALPVPLAAQTGPASPVRMESHIISEDWT